MNRVKDRRRTRVAALALILLAGTSLNPTSAQQAPNAPPRAMGLTPPVKTSPLPSAVNNDKPSSAQEDSDPVPALPGMQVFQGSGEFVNPGAGKAVSNRAGDVTLDFTDADVRDVVRAVLGEIMQRSYTIDPKVTGKITLKTGRPITKEAVLSALEAALKINGAAINMVDDVLNVVPIADAQHHGQIAYGSDESGVAGYGIEIVPLEYVSAEEMQRVLTPLVPEGAITQIDAKRNLIFLAGTEPERAEIRATITRFDVNYLKGMSFALIQPTHADADTLASELDKIFGEANSPIAGLVRIVPIARINSLLIVTARPKYLKEVQRWVGRLDIATVTPNRKLYFYRLQNARARDVAEILGRIFGTGASSGMSDTYFPQATNNSQISGSFSRSSSTFGSSTRNMQSSNLQSSNLQTSNQQSSNAQFAQIPQTSLSAPAGSLSRGSNALANGPQIVTDEGNNALIIRADAADYAAIEDVITKMDVTPNQVLVEATIVEVTLNDTLKYGVEWYFRHNNKTFTMSPNGDVSTHFPGFGATFIVPDISVAVSTIGALTDVTVLSSPKILTLDNKSATIEVGDQIPIVTQTAVSTTAQNAPVVSSIEQRDTGVILSVTPRIGNSGIVYLEVSQEVSASTPTTTSNIDSPTIQQRRLQSTVAVNDGATIALGGLIQRSDTVSNSGIPYLKDIPVMGGLFSTRSAVRGRTELLVFLTPHVIRNLPTALDATYRLKQEMADVRKAMDEIVSQTIPQPPW